MSLPANLKYTKDHEWLEIIGDRVRVGITQFAQEQLGELVFVELPKLKTVKAGEAFCVVESTKAASDVYAPVSGEVVEVNSALKDTPNLINATPYTDGWIAIMKNADLSSANLLSAEEYAKLVH